MTAILVATYIVGVVLFAGIMHGLNGWNEPWIILALFWPIAVPIMSVYFATRRVKRFTIERAQAMERDRAEESRRMAEQSRLLREAGLEP